MSFIKELFTAYAQNGIIYGCKEKSLCWYHEKGHLERFKNNQIKSLYGHTILLGTPLLYISVDFPLVFNLIGIAWILIISSFEIDAWVYSYKQYKKELK